MAKKYGTRGPVATQSLTKLPTVDMIQHAVRSMRLKGTLEHRRDG